MRKLLFLGLLFFCINSFAQTGRYTTQNSRAIKSFDKAIEYYGSRSYTLAEEALQEALKADPKFVEAQVLLANIYTDVNKKEEAIEAYKKAIALNPDTFPNNYYSVAKIEMELGKYEEAKSHLEKFLSIAKSSSVLVSKARKFLESANFAIEALKKPVPFKPINLGDSVNSKNEEYLPTLTADENTLIFTVRRPKDAQTIGRNLEEEDFFVSKKEKGNWKRRMNLGSPINTHGNEGAQCISPDGKYLYYTACNRPNGLGSCDIFMAEKIGDSWSEPVNMGAPVNSNAWESQPSISSDGRTLYFLSSRNGGLGKTDIWKTTHMDDGSWSVPVNLGDKINTSGSEASPFIHPDNNTLYFASDGKIGMGGADLFISRRDEKGEWATASNLGYPINTNADESSLIVGAGGKVAYFSSDRPEGLGGLDLYSFELYKAAQPLPVSYAKGKVYNNETKKSVEAKFELIDLATAKTVVESSSDKITGEFLVCLPSGKNYALNVSKPGYLFYSENFTLKDTGKIATITMDVPLKPIKIGQSAILKNIFFDSNSFSLKGESKAELGKLKAFIIGNPGVIVELGGHTDNTGDKKSNQVLSEKRAKAVYDHLIGEGVPAASIAFKGYGDTKPVASNDSPEGKAKNRRTEFMIIGNK